MPGALTRWEPLSELSDLRNRFDHMFDDLWDGRQNTWSPLVDVARENGNLIVHADIPGIKPEDVKIEIEDGVLTISGQREEKSEEKDRHILRRERRYGSFCRSLTLPAGVDAKKVKAESHDGVVEVRIPLPKEADKQKVTIAATPVA